MRAIDPLVYCLTVVASLLITLLASSIPATRAAKLEDRDSVCSADVSWESSRSKWPARGGRYKPTS